MFYLKCQGVIKPASHSWHLKVIKNKGLWQNPCSSDGWKIKEQPRQWSYPGEGTGKKAKVGRVDNILGCMRKNKSVTLETNTFESISHLLQWLNGFEIDLNCRIYKWSSNVAKHKSPVTMPKIPKLEITVSTIGHCHCHHSQKMRWVN